MWSGVILPTTTTKEPDRYLVFDGNSLGPHTVFFPEKKMTSLHLIYPPMLLFRAIQAGRRVSPKDKGELPLLPPFHVRGPMGSHGHSEFSIPSIYAGRVCLFRDQQASLILSHALLPTGLATMHGQRGKGLPKGAQSPAEQTNCSSPALGNELRNLLWV